MYLDKYMEGEIMKIVIKFVEEMGLKVFFLEKFILFVLVFFIFEKIEEVL